AAAGGDRRSVAWAGWAMNPGGLSWAVAVGGAVAAALAALAGPHRSRRVVVGVLAASSGAAGVAAGVGALTGPTFAVARPELLPLFGLRFHLVPLGGVFVAVTGGVAMAAAVYGIGYPRHGLDGRVAQAGVPVFVASMVLV